MNAASTDRLADAVRAIARGALENGRDRVRITFVIDGMIYRYELRLVGAAAKHPKRPAPSPARA